MVVTVLHERLDERHGRLARREQPNCLYRARLLRPQIDVMGDGHVLGERRRSARDQQQQSDNTPAHSIIHRGECGYPARQQGTVSSGQIGCTSSRYVGRSLFRDWRGLGVAAATLCSSFPLMPIWPKCKEWARVAGKV